jgi:H+/Cl- antiporter ClcA
MKAHETDLEPGLRLGLEQWVILPGILRWSVLAAAAGLLSGAASALFLHSLDWVTETRESHRWVIAGLPLAGLVMGWVYHQIGRPVEGGNDLILEEIHDPKKTIPARMAPLILFATLVTHFFGGSVGREGTAVQMGGSLADQFSPWLKLIPERRKILLMAGMSAGFASVFGTPLAGTVFGLEVLAFGLLRYDAIFPCLVAAVVGHFTTQFLGVRHEHYTVGTIPDVTAIGLLSALAAGAVFGVAGMIFARAMHFVSRLYREKIAYGPFRPFIGGALVAASVLAVGSTRYIGLGTPVIHEALAHRLPIWDFVGKLYFTVMTLASGFKGGEVTPLFYMGATLGSSLSAVLALPTGLLAAMGFIAVFAGAANTPLACLLLGIEVFGAQGGVYFAIACVASYLFSGHAGIYHSQKMGHSKRKL